MNDDVHNVISSKENVNKVRLLIGGIITQSVSDLFSNSFKIFHNVDICGNRTVLFIQ